MGKQQFWQNTRQYPIEAETFQRLNRPDCDMALDKNSFYFLVCSVHGIEKIIKTNSQSREYMGKNGQVVTTVFLGAGLLFQATVRNSHEFRGRNHHIVGLIVI